MRNYIGTIMAGIFAIIVAAQSIGAFGAGLPKLYAPYPIPLVVLRFLDWPLGLVLLLFGAVFWIWHPGLFLGKPYIPIRTIVLFVLVTMLSAIWFYISWSYGVEWRGEFFTLGAFILSLAFFAICGLLIIYARKRPSFAVALITHTLLFSWIASYAFPYLGETP